MLKKLVLGILSCFSLAAESQTLYEFPITRVIDGDTVVFEYKQLPEPLKPELHLRVWGIDTPEKNFLAKCDTEKELGIKATEFTSKLINESKKIQVELKSWDKYGGRVLGNIYLDGVNLRAILIQKGYAKEYYGGGKQSWCK